MSTNSVPVASARRRAVSPKDHLLHLVAVDDHRDHDVRTLGDLARGARDRAAVLGVPRLGALSACG
jgi:hypothetical protein